MTKAIFIFLLASALCLPHTARADAAGCMTNFYQTKDMTCPETVAGILSQPTVKNVNPNAAGFLAVIFNDYPQIKQQLLKMNAPQPAKATYTVALYEGGLTGEAAAYANSAGLSGLYAQLTNHQTPLLDALKPSINPGDNDLLIGAYMASGNIGYIQSILDNFSGADDGTVADALRLSLVQSKFGPSMTPQGRDKTMMQAACDKYQCKTNMQALMHVMTLSSAFWAMRSLSQHDASVKKTFDDFFENDPRLKRLSTNEETAFGNYITTLAIYAAIKDNANVNASLSIYEKLGSGLDAANALAKK